MNFSRIALLGLGALAGATGIFGVLKFRAARETRAAVVALQQRHEAQQARIASLETQVAASRQRIAAIEHDNTELETAMEKRLAAKTVPPAPPSQREWEKRVERALELAKSGDAETAWRELLWCFDEGAIGTRGSPSLNTKASQALRKLREEHPAALPALRERIEKLRQRLMAPQGDRAEISTLAALARAAGDEAVLLSIFDQLPPGDRRRSSVANYASDQLIAARRYRDAMEGKNYEAMRTSFEIAFRSGTGASDSLRDVAIRRAASNIEVLAGTGELERAREFSAKVLDYDRSPETAALLKAHLARAGQPELLSPAGK